MFCFEHKKRDSSELSLLNVTETITVLIKDLKPP